MVWEPFLTLPWCMVYPPILVCSSVEVFSCLSLKLSMATAQASCTGVPIREPAEPCALNLVLSKHLGRVLGVLGILLSFALLPERLLPAGVHLSWEGFPVADSAGQVGCGLSFVQGKQC